MDAALFERAARGFAACHRRFAPLFGRAEARRRSEQDVRGLLVRRADRRNAENLAEAVADASARAFQRLLSGAPWDADAVVAEVQGYLAERLAAPGGVLVLDGTGFPKQGTKPAGVARQYSGTLGKVGDCRVGVFLAYASARGGGLVDRRLYLPARWAEDRARCAAAGVPAAVGFPTKAELGLAMLRQAGGRGQLAGRWVTGDEQYGQVPGFRDALDAEGWHYVLEVPRTTPVFAAQAGAAIPPWSGKGRPPTKPRLAAGAPPARPVAAVAAAATDWRPLTVATGEQGPRTYGFVGRRVRESRAGLPGRARWLVLRRNLDGTGLKAYLSNAPADTPLDRLGEVGAVRWAIETAFRAAKGEAGLDEYEARGWRGWHHHVTLAMLAAASLLHVQQDRGGKLPALTIPRVSRVLRELLPRRRWNRAELWGWLVDTQARNRRATRSHTKRRQARAREPSL